MDHLPPWLSNLTDEDMSFIKNFILSSGSLKQMAQLYQVSYPTMRLRLNRVIEKVKLHDSISDDPFILLVKSLAIDDKYDIDTARTLINAYKRRKDQS